MVTEYWLCERNSKGTIDTRLSCVYQESDDAAISNNCLLRHSDLCFSEQVFKQRMWVPINLDPYTSCNFLELIKAVFHEM